jgi:predicted amidophosphoribosyltransferase
MQAVQMVLLIVVAASALPLVAFAVVPRLRARRRSSRPPSRDGQPPAVEPAPATAARVAPPPPLGLICPACRREYPSGLKYCPKDARALVANVSSSSPLPRRAPSGLTCPVCRRSFEGNKKFCPYDAEELVPSSLAAARKVGMGPPGLAHVLGKICPHCAKRYDSDATFCGRDGSELVSVN